MVSTKTKAIAVVIGIILVLGFALALDSSSSNNTTTVLQPTSMAYSNCYQYFEFRESSHSTQTWIEDNATAIIGAYVECLGG